MYDYQFVWWLLHILHMYMWWLLCFLQQWELLGGYLLSFISVQNDWQYISVQGMDCCCSDIWRKASELQFSILAYMAFISYICLFSLLALSLWPLPPAQTDHQIYVSCVNNSQNVIALFEELESVFKNGIWVCIFWCLRGVIIDFSRKRNTLHMPWHHKNSFFPK